jgi:AcrR family transcriptional regulator
LEVAAKLFATHGYEGTTTAAIAEAAGVTEPILYRHFTGKQQLFVAIVRAMSDKTIAHWKGLVEGIPDPLEQIRRIARQFPDQLEHLSDAYRVLHGALALSKDPAVLAVVRDHYKATQAFFAQIIARGQEGGRLTKDIDPNLPAWEIINLGIGFAMISLTLPGIYGDVDQVAMVEMVLDCFKTS